MTAEPPSGTVTLLFTDVEGSTRLLHALGPEGYAEALAAHRRTLREAFARHGGTEVDTQGDSFFVVFPTAQAAAGAAQDGQLELAGGPLSVRMGMHTGEAHLTPEGYVGADVHLGARIAAAGHGGQILLSAATAGLVTAPLTDLGDHRLKDFDRPVGIFQLGDESFPPLKTISNTNLPRPASSFVGREREIAEVLALLRDGARLVTLSGPGGAGKTRLAIEVATELLPEVKAGVFWVGLATMRDPALVMDTVANTLGAKDGAAAHIGRSELLLLLIDNFEQVVDTAPEIAELLASCPNLRLLVTSRELLRIDGEVEYTVPPLAEGEAVALFCARSRLEPDEDIRELCRRLDELPLAVELAAARTSVLTPAQILERIGQRLDLLKGGRATDERQQTLRATIAWSADLLSDEEQQLFARLAVFSGGCTLEAAEEIADADIDTVQALVQKSLVRFTNGRFWMLETIREFALERLAELPEAASLGRRHAEYFLRFAQERSRAHTRAMLDELAADHDNIRAARAWLEANGEIDSELELAAAMHRMADTRGHWREELAAVESALARADAASPAAQALGWQALENSAYSAGDLARAAEAGERALALHRSVGNDSGAASVLMVLGIIAAEVGDYGRAAALYAEARELAARLGERTVMAAATQNLGLFALIRGDLAAARKLSAESLERFSELGDESGVIPALENLGIAELFDGNLGRARELLVESLDRSRAMEARFGILNALVGLAALSAAEGEPERAAQLLGAADAVRDEAGADRFEALEARLHEETTERIRAEIGEEALAAAYAQGRSLSLDAAVELGLGAR